MNAKYLCAVLILLLGAAASAPSRAQTTFSEDFTGTSTANSWYYFSGACLTAGSSAAGSNPGTIPGCAAVLSSYYSLASDHDASMVGGSSGFLGSASAPSTPDPVGSGALRFTNGAPYGHNEKGAILSANTFNTGAGLQVTFKTVTYKGNSYGVASDGADGISFFLMDGSKPPGLGAFGGSLAYSCSNNNGPYDGLNGGYIGLGIDEFGNFLNGANWVSGYTGPNAATGDNAAYGYGYKPGRIGLRGAGSISWAALNGAYGTDPGNSASPYYPASLATSCAVSGGTYSSASSNCIDVCTTAGSYYYAPGNVCNKACTGGGGSIYNPSTDMCMGCTSGTGGTVSGGLGGQCINTTNCPGTHYFAGTSTCDSCPATGYATGTWNSSNATCTNSCPTGWTLTGTNCYPSGSAYSSGFYCPAGDTIVAYPAGNYLCYTTGLSYSNGNYCPSGQTITGSSCYPTGDSKNTTTLKYCATGQTINTAGTNCYPNSDSNSGNNYCPAGQTINTAGTNCYTTGLSNSGNFYCPSGYTISGTTLCYVTGASKSGNYYCPTGQTISTSGGNYCFPTASPVNVAGNGFYCPNGSTAPTSAGKCCTSPNTYNTVTSKCSNGVAATNATAETAATAMSASLAMSAATVMGAATAMSAATAATAATAVTPAQTVAATQAPTTNTALVGSAPGTATPTTAYVDAVYSVQNTCKTGILWNYGVSATAPSNAGSATLSNAANTAGILDYAPIPNAYKELTSFQIANESATTRSQATPIFYQLKITQDGLLSFSYSTGGAYSALISNQSITSANGPLPPTFRVGFAASSGGGTNIHEIMCFKAASANTSGSSATVNEKQAAKVEAGTQAYFAYYNPNDWTGTVTANTLIDTAGVVTVATTANWDASCLLSGTANGSPTTGGGCATTNASGPTPATPAPAGRVMLTWDTTNSVGIPFEWGSLNPAQQAALTAGDATPGPNRLNYLRGDRTNEINSAGAGLYRARDAVLGDIVDSSPAWVGPPNSPYTATWQDRLAPTTVMPENSVAQSYVLYTQAEQTRQNVVYVGSNDGFLHGFRAGSFDNVGNFVANATTPNDGQEILSYMPGSLMVSAAASGAPGGCTMDANTGTQVQQIHGVTPAIGTNPLCVEPVLDYSNTQYGHNFFVDATPGTGDLYYGGQWHSWLVSGLGTGGAAIFALDVTNPSYSESNASSTVIGEWNAGTISCALVSNCGNNMGNTFGTPQLRRLHDGNWAAIFGNGLNSQTGDAGIYIMSVNNSSGAVTFYYLSTGVAGSNGIAYVTPADLDGDHITDYVYAGDLNGNVWRFDLTASNESQWGVTNAGGISINALSGGGGPGVPLFTTQSGQPITSQLLVISSLVSGAPRLMIEFGTGQRTQLTNLAPVIYASGTQSMYGIWDWNLSNWNAMAPAATYQSLTAGNTGLGAPYTVTRSNLLGQTLTPNASTVPSGGGNATVVDGTNATICWQGSAACGSGNNQFGWYADLPFTNEQIIFNPVFYQGGFLVNSTVPANNSLVSCNNNQDTGYTYALNVANGGVFTNTFPTYTPNGTVVTDAQEAGVQTNATGSVYIVTTAEHTINIVYQTISGTPGAQKINLPPNTKSKRLTWIEKR
jgi:type IV pilus assembly protein PilY1